MKIKTYQTSFVRGELSPLMFARENLPTYANGAAKVRNCYVLHQGGVARREGMQYIDRVTNDAKARLIAFEFNTEQVYLLVFTPGEMKVYRNDILQTIVTGAPISNLTAAVLEDMNWTQSADTLILVHPDIQPIRITRTSHTVWTASLITFSNIPTYDYGSGAEAVISTTRGWPCSVAFADSRLWLGGLKSRPQTLLSSVVGSFFDLNNGTGLDDEGINITIDDDRVNAIRNLFPGRTLQVFTTGGEFYIQGALGDPITPGKIATQLKRGTAHGSTRTRPVSVDGTTIFVQNGGRVVRRFAFNDLDQSYNAENISLFSPHLIENPLRMDVRRATETMPADFVYNVNEDGTISVLNILASQDLIAWSLFETQGRAEDIAITEDVVYFSVQRSINGSQVRYIEKLNPDYKTDCAMVQQVPVVPFSPWLWLTRAVPATSWTGFDHLNGMTVKVFGDDYILNDVTVQGGQVTASESVQKLEVGLPFFAEIETLPASIVIAGQSEAGDYKRLAYVEMRLLQSRGVVVRQKTGETYKPAWRQFGAEVINTPVELYDGWKKVFLGGFDRDTQVIITQEDPLEFNVLGLKLGVGV